MKNENALLTLFFVTYNSLLSIFKTLFNILIKLVKNARYTLFFNTYLWESDFTRYISNLTPQNISNLTPQKENLIQMILLYF